MFEYRLCVVFSTRIPLKLLFSHVENGTHLLVRPLQGLKEIRHLPVTWYPLHKWQLDSAGIQLYLASLGAGRVVLLACCYSGKLEGRKEGGAKQELAFSHVHPREVHCDPLQGLLVWMAVLLTSSSPWVPQEAPTVFYFLTNRRTPNFINDKERFYHRLSGELRVPQFEGKISDPLGHRKLCETPLKVQACSF